MIPKFYSKVLLFGEYAVIHNGDAFAIPNKTYHGILDYGDVDHEKQMVFHQMIEYIEETDFSLFHSFDKEEWDEDLELGMYFKSNIPIGYGLGSSGALVASIYKKYVNRYTTESLLDLKSDLSVLESLFHGSSSGLDPLVSILNKPIHIDQKKELHVLDHSNFELIKDIRLYDTRISRETGPFVEIFKKKLKDVHFRYEVMPPLIEENRKAISAFLNNDRATMVEAWKAISIIQFEHFKEMIPEKFIHLWKNGLDESQYIFKLCGAGGGGFLLCLLAGRKAEGLLHLNGIKVEKIICD